MKSGTVQLDAPVVIVPRFREFAIQNMVGTSGRQRVAATDLARFALPAPNADWLNGFGLRAAALFTQIESLQAENRTLAATRDALLVSNTFVLPSSGPITWLAEVVRALGGEPASWLTAIPVWLTDPQRSILLPIAVLASAALSTLSLRSYDLTGLRVLAFVCAIVAVEIQGSIFPMVWIVLVAAVPFAAAVVLGFLPDKTEHDGRQWSFFYPAGAARYFVMRVIGLYAMPIAAPILLFPALVVSYRIERGYRPSEALADVVARNLAEESENGTTLSSSDPMAMASAIVAAITSTSPSTRSQQVAAIFDHRIRERRNRSTRGAVRDPGVHRPSSRTGSELSRVNGQQSG